MKNLAVCLLLLASPAALRAAATAKPNILYILTDDLGYGDVQALNPQRGKIKTPHLDRLATQGMTFTDAHSGSSVCTPTRYGLLTGRYAWRTRLQHGVLDGDAKPLIAADRLTVASLLKQHGYFTAAIGKWHLGMNLPPASNLAAPISEGPLARGFDYFFGISASLDMPPFAFIENDRYTEAPTAQKTWLRKGAAAPGFEAVDVLPALTRKAVEIIGQRAADAKAGKPFFIYLPLTSPHTPILPTPEWQGKSGLGAYCDFVMQTDAAVGEVLAALEKAGVAENTLVIFTSDNGCSPAAGIQKLEAQGHFPSAQFRGNKSTIWDGGHRVPFLVRWPGKVKAGVQNTRLICHTDFMATCAEIVGAKLPDNAGEDSVSLLPALLGAEKPEAREAVVHHSIHGKFAIRRGPWKLALCAGSGGWSKDGGPESPQLYDFDAHPGETKNLAAEKPGIVTELTALMEKFVADGRSTPGPKQANDVPVVFYDARSQPKKAQAAPADKAASPAKTPVLKAESFQHYVEDFNKNDNELYKGAITNAAAWDFLKANIPLLDCPDEDIATTYYFRWWTYRKHIKQTPAGFIVDEFLPNVSWAGKFNSISCAAGHHLYEGRWLRDPKILDDYSRFWFRGGGEPRRYSFWAADSIWARSMVTGDKSLAADLLPDLIGNYQAWEKSHRDASGLFWQIDDRDGMEVSIGGSGHRATINSYLFGDALAISRLAELAGKADIAGEFKAKAVEIKKLVQEKLWDANAQFFKVLPRGENKALAEVRELHGFTPWYFNLPDPQFAVAWKQAMDPQGFFAAFGLTTTEQRHPKFSLSYAGHECQWNGPSWPYATSVTLTGLANLLNGPAQYAIGAKDYFDLLKIYAKSHKLKLEDGRVVQWIDENQNPTTGDWISRTRLKTWRRGTWDGGKGGVERGKDYNHSTFCDLVISGLVGLRPRADNTVEVNPLAPPAWDYFCLDQIPYHGHTLTILFDKTGARYGRGKGLRVFADGKEIAASEKLARVTGPLPAPAAAETSGGWRKFAGNPVMGGKYGTCFDISVLREGDTYRMYLSWRPKKSLAIVESKDGIHWSEPPQIVLGPRPETGWEEEINRPSVLKKGDTYHLWYTGQTKARSWIGYATSNDGVTWKRMSDKPVLTADQPWELNIAVMCPSVLWDEETRLFRMWYSGGEQNEPNAIGYATSPDGLAWTKQAANPVCTAEPKNPWEKHKVTGCQVEKIGDWYVMFYIGFQDEATARICLARSKDGITNWQRHPANPVIFSGKNKWDHHACYKPYAIFDGQKWLLWYNGRHASLEQIGVVLRDGKDLGFEP